MIGLAEMVLQKRQWVERIMSINPKVPYVYPVPDMPWSGPAPIPYSPRDYYPVDEHDQDAARVADILNRGLNPPPASPPPPSSSGS